MNQIKFDDAPMTDDERSRMDWLVVRALAMILHDTAPPMTEWPVVAKSKNNAHDVRGMPKNDVAVLDVIICVLLTQLKLMKLPASTIAETLITKAATIDSSTKSVGTLYMRAIALAGEMFADQIKMNREAGLTDLGEPKTTTKGN